MPEIDVEVYDDTRIDAVVERVVDSNSLCTRFDIDIEYKLAKEMASSVFNTVKKHGEVNRAIVMQLFHEMITF
jgi:hypothetical protein